MTRTIITAFDDDSSRPSHTKLIDGALLCTQGTEADVIDSMREHHKGDHFLLIGLDPVEEKANCIWRRPEGNEMYRAACGTLTDREPARFCPYCGLTVHVIHD